MSVREFLRGGYKEPGEPIIVVSGNEVLLVAFPGTSALTVAAPAAVQLTGVIEESHMEGPTRVIAKVRPTGTAALRPTAVQFNPAPKPGKKRAAR